MLPIMLSVKPQYPNHEFVITGVSSIPEDIYQQYLSEQQGISIEYDNFDSVLKQAEAALITSGTATLQAALLKVPLVVCYKASTFSYLIAKRLINTEFISLVNLIMGREIVAELIQGQCNRVSLKQELDKLLQEKPRQAMLNEFYLLPEKLGEPGASARAAELMLGYLR
jgi:lipid-A-disaccharide synthase